jgi:hypothetical protein
MVDALVTDPAVATCEIIMLKYRRLNVRLKATGLDVIQLKSALREACIYDGNFHKCEYVEDGNVCRAIPTTTTTITTVDGQTCTGRRCAPFCTGDLCGASCVGTDCAFRCHGAFCGIGCVGQGCAESCLGLRMCGLGCVGTDCAKDCAGTQCGVGCHGTNCRADPDNVFSYATDPAVATCMAIGIKYNLLLTLTIDSRTRPFLLKAYEAACLYEPNVHKCEFIEATLVCRSLATTPTTAGPITVIRTTTTATTADGAASTITTDPATTRAAATTQRRTTVLPVTPAPPPPPSPPAQTASAGGSSKKKGASGGVIAGIAVGSIAGVAGVAVVIKFALAGGYAAVPQSATGGPSVQL